MPSRSGAPRLDGVPPDDPCRTRVRAAALPPRQRRAAIIEATVPLLIEFGTAITTRQIAEAAGIAEGTIFRVFPDKESLIAAAVEQAFDPAPVDAELRAIDAALPLAARLEIAVEILQRRITTVWRLITGVGTPPPGGPPTSLPAFTELLEPDRAQLNREPARAAQVLRAMTFAGTHPRLIGEEPLPPAEIVAIFLDGVRVRGEGQC
jgi:AcrR family transcriptional regulator